MARKKPNIEDEVEVLTNEIAEVMSNIRTNTTPKNLKELAYFIMQFSGYC
jgi:hypothetical protein